VKVFLGGTCNGSKWRDELIKMLEIDYFYPVVENWTKNNKPKEIQQRRDCDYCLYVITPKMTGVYSIAEVVDDSNKRPEKTMFCYLNDDENKSFDEHQKKSLHSVSEMVSDNGAKVFDGLDNIAAFLNSRK